ncbi:MAG: type IV pilin [Methanophagales archaeon ANME-1-THS]|nr:MAG: type IV pilin [Methanophagales archaeon ANME-1-THS]
MERRGNGRTLMKDERGVSPVIGVILMIAITVVIAAVVASFAYGIIGGVATAPNSALIFENADLGKTNITLVHHGGDSVTNAFTGSTPSDWGDMRVKLNGVDIIWRANVTVGGDTDPNFESGEQLRIKVPPLASGDTISVIYVPTGDILQRVKVA